MANCYDNPVEAMEMKYPLRVERVELLPGSGGAGQFRGGLGLSKTVRYLGSEGYFTNRSDGQRFPAPGVLGGLQGRPSRHGIWRADGEQLDLPSKMTNLPIRSGDLIVLETAAGGGYGSPLDRAPAAVLDDLLDEKIDAHTATCVYGLVLSSDGTTVDETRTARRRAEFRAQRSPESPPLPHSKPVAG
jgi:N-methylhydantoinase B